MVSIYVIYDMMRALVENDSAPSLPFLGSLLILFIDTLAHCSPPYLHSLAMRV